MMSLLRKLSAAFRRSEFWCSLAHHPKPQFVAEDVQVLWCEKCQETRFESQTDTAW